MAQRRTKSPTPTANDDVYTMGEAARLKGVSYHTVSRAVRRGKLPAQRLGRMALITAADLQAWQPMVERAPKKYRRREPDQTAVPALVDLASGERVDLARRLALLIEANHELAMGLPAAEFVTHLAERFAQAFGLRRVDVWQWDRNGGEARRRASVGLPATADDQPARDAQDVARWRKLATAALHEGTAGETGTTLLTGATTLVAAPLRVAGDDLGVVLGDRAGARFKLSSADLQLAQALANQAAIAFELERLRSASGDGEA